MLLESSFFQAVAAEAAAAQIKFFVNAAVGVSWIPLCIFPASTHRQAPLEWPLCIAVHRAWAVIQFNFPKEEDGFSEAWRLSVGAFRVWQNSAFYATSLASSAFLRFPSIA